MGKVKAGSPVTYIDVFHKNKKGRVRLGCLRLPRGGRSSRRLVVKGTPPPVSSKEPSFNRVMDVVTVLWSSW
jgi:hypothetical protein